MAQWCSGEQCRLTARDLVSIQDQGHFLCGVYMFSLCLCGFSLIWLVLNTCSLVTQEQQTEEPLLCSVQVECIKIQTNTWWSGYKALLFTSVHFIKDKWWQMLRLCLPDNAAALERKTISLFSELWHQVESLGFRFFKKTVILHAFEHAFWSCPSLCYTFRPATI